MMDRLRLLAPAVLMALALPCAAQQADPKMSFFIVSEGSGNGAALGGLKGADAHCQKLAAAAGAGKKKWRAYLSETQPGKSR